MKIHVEIQPDCQEPHAIIYTNTLSDEVVRLVETLNQTEVCVIASLADELVILKPADIYMVKVEDERCILYGQDRQFHSKKRLYELARDLGSQFMQISKGTIINLRYMESIEPKLNGGLLLKLKNGSRDYVSRKYLPDLKRYLGL